MNQLILVLEVDFGTKLNICLREHTVSSAGGCVANHWEDFYPGRCSYPAPGQYFVSNTGSDSCSNPEETLARSTVVVEGWAGADTPRRPLQG